MPSCFLPAQALALPVCEDLALALFVKGLRGEATEVEAWNVLEYVRQRDMITRPAVSPLLLLLLWLLVLLLLFIVISVVVVVVVLVGGGGGDGVVIGVVVVVVIVDGVEYAVSKFLLYKQPVRDNAAHIPEEAKRER